MNDLLEAFFYERALLYDEESLPVAGKTPPTSVQGADLATTVEGGKGDLGPNSTPSQGLRVLPPSKHNYGVETQVVHFRDMVSFSSWKEEEKRTYSNYVQQCVPQLYRDKQHWYYYCN